MKSTSTPKPRLAILLNPVRTDRDSTYGDSVIHELRIVRVENDQPRNICRTSCFETPELAMFDDLTFRVYIRFSDGKWDVGGAYVEYRDVYTVDLRTAETMVRGLKRCGKVYDAFPVRPATFGQYCALMAQGLGVREVIRESTGSRGRGTGFYSDSIWQVFPIKDAQHLIDASLEEAREKLLPESVKEVA